MAAQSCYGGPMLLMPNMPPPRHARSMGRIARFAFATTALLAIAGCSTSRYPSLERRPSEISAPPEADHTGTAQPATVPATLPATAPAAVPQALRARLDSIAARAHAAENAFRTSEEAARRQCAAAAGAEPGSPAWGAANDAIAVLDGQRAATALVLADIEQIYTDDRMAHALEDGSAGTPETRPAGAAIAQVRATIDAMLVHQDGVLADLTRQLKN